jgi:hypothetical protein
MKVEDIARRMGATKGYVSKVCNSLTASAAAVR